MHHRRLAGAVLVAFVACGLVWAQDAPKPGAKPTAIAANQAAEKLTGRLPNNYAKVGVTDAQRQRIYALQAKYSAQIDALTQQLEELRQKRDAEVEGVLTPDQKEKLKALTDATATKKASRAKPEPEKKPDAPK
jgi:Spy/CpxP family protein refolding chaperone